MSLLAREGRIVTGIQEYRVAAKDRVCSPDLGTGRSQCGRRGQRTDVWSKVTCPDCLAARRADG